MTLHLSKEEFDRLRRIIEGFCGISVNEKKAYLVENRLSNIVNEMGLGSFADLAAALENNKDLQLRNRVIDKITTNETLWFRDRLPFTFFAEELLPRYISDLKDGRKNSVRIWSAAASTGQEAYSLAMLLCGALEKGPKTLASKFEIIGTDISESCIKMAQRGEYDWVMMQRGLSDAYRSRYFEQVGRKWHVSEEIRNMVQFKKYNLQQSFSALGRFDLIFCRNVAIYFSADFKRELYAKFSKTLNPEGVFILGASESISGYCDDFELRQYKDGFYYTLRKQPG